MYISVKEQIGRFLKEILLEEKTKCRKHLGPNPTNTNKQKSTKEFGKNYYKNCILKKSL